MYIHFFGLREMPFSITPDPSYLYMSPRHQEALGHLLYGTGQYGGFVQLTGEVGTGKTTIIRTLLEQKLDNVDVAMIHNPRQSEAEFVQSICDEMGVSYDRNAPTLKGLVDALNAHLLDAHARGRRTVLIIDEAQNLDPAVLEQVRLLTNLETHKEKLLRIMLVGQPELRELLSRPDLRQLAQRITARYHLEPLNEAETAEYVRHRLRVAGAVSEVFDPQALRAVYARSRGIPRLINIICDRALLGAYGMARQVVSASVVLRAAWESVHGEPDRRRGGRGRRFSDRIGSFWLSTEKIWAVAAVLFAGLFFYQQWRDRRPEPPPAPPAAPVVTAAAAPDAATLALQQAQPLPVVMNALIALWDPRLRLAPDSNLCEGLHERGLDCYRSEGNWNDLATLNRPAVLTLATPTGETRHVLLRALSKTMATLQAGSGEQSVPLTQLDAVWNGEFLLLWPRETEETMIGPASQGKDVVWLRKRLAQASGRPLPPFLSSFFDEALAQSLRRFQQAHGLDPDGLAGIRTLIVLGAARSDTPTLDHTAPAAAPEPAAAAGPAP